MLYRAGLWLNIPDYDAPTQMVKPHERNTRYVDAVMTIPKVRQQLLLIVCIQQEAHRTRLVHIEMSIKENQLGCKSAVRARSGSALGVVRSIACVQGTLFPMCGMNLAFDRVLIGPAMYFGLMGDGQPLGRYDDMWAGWCSKARS